MIGLIFTLFLYYMRIYSGIVGWFSRSPLYFEYVIIGNHYQKIKHFVFIGEIFHINMYGSQIVYEKLNPEQLLFF